MMEPLVTALSTSLELMANTSAKLKRGLGHATGPAKQLLEVIGNASAYMHDFVKDGGSPANAMDQFCQHIGDYQRILGDRLLDFREAAAVQILINRGAMRM